MRAESIIVVTGLPRSGTSVMMQMLAAGGVPILTDSVRPADESNPRGYLEFEAVKRLRSDQSWLDEARGRAVKIIHVLLRDLPVDGRFSYRVVFMQRPLDEIIASQSAMLQRTGKRSADAATLQRIYANQLREVEQWLAQQPAFAVLPMQYHRVINDAAAVAQEVSSFLRRALDRAAMIRAVDPQLYRQRAADKQG